MGFVWFLSVQEGITEVNVSDVIDLFSEYSIGHPNKTRLAKKLVQDSRTLSCRSGKAIKIKSKALKNLDEQFSTLIVEDQQSLAELFDIDGVSIPDNLPTTVRDDLRLMIGLYARLYILENSVREIISSKLERELGVDWWKKVATKGMLEKHAGRQKKELSNRWAPTRTESGPLYSVDWPDLVTLMRKYPDYFLPIIGDISFMHRFEDAGIFRNVVAHNGVIADSDTVKLVDIYLKNWVDQIGSRPA